MFRNIKKEIYNIIKYISIYIIITFIISIVGPVSYNNYNYLKVGLYLMFIIISIWGAMLIFLNKKQDYSYVEIDKKEKKYIDFINICIYISIIMYSILFIRLIIKNNFSIIKIFSNLAHIGDTYKSYLHADTETTDVLVKFMTIISVIPFIAMCGGVYYFKNKNLKRNLFLFFVGISLLEEILEKGQLVSIVNFISIIVSILFMKFISRRANKKEAANNKKNIIFIGIIFLIVFGYFQNSRANTYNYSTQTLSNKYFIYNNEHYIYKIMPESVAETFSYLSFYLSGGYYRVIT